MQAGNALVTGASKRLGRAMALTLAERGFNVAVHFDRSETEAEAVADEIRALSRNSAALQADLLKERETDALVDRAAEALGGPLNVLINNASIFEYDNIETASRRSWDRHMESNLRAPFVLTQRFSEQAPRETWDADGEATAAALVVNMIDQRVRKLTPEFMTYTIAKMGLWTLTQTAAQALAPRIRVNAIGPGPTLRGSRQTESHFTQQRHSTVLNRGADAADISRALEYFLTAPAVTGQMLCVDGGQHLGWETPDILGVE